MQLLCVWSDFSLLTQISAVMRHFENTGVIYLDVELCLRETEQDVVDKSVDEQTLLVDISFIC